MPPLVEPPHPGQGGVKVGGAGTQREELPVAIWWLRGMRQWSHVRDLSESYSTSCSRTPCSTTDFKILAVYQRELAGSGSCHQTAILCPVFRALAIRTGVLLVFPCSILRKRFHLAWETPQKYGVFCGGRASG